jgi:hypothetical protein
MNPLPPKTADSPREVALNSNDTVNGDAQDNGRPIILGNIHRALTASKIKNAGTTHSSNPPRKHGFSQKVQVLTAWFRNATVSQGTNHTRA